MFAVTILLAGAPSEVALFYDTEAAATAVVDSIWERKDPHAPFRIADERGHTADFLPRNIVHVRITDMAKDIENQADLALLQQREQAKLQARAERDPGLSFLRGLGARPHIFGNNGPNKAS